MMRPILSEACEYCQPWQDVVELDISGYERAKPNEI
jgi:hypothetical protein